MEKEFTPKNREKLTEKEKETLTSFKTILQPWPWGNQRDKVDLLLVWRGLKSATQISLDPEISTDDLKKTEEVIKNAGLFFKDSGVVEKFNIGGRRLCFVANNPKDLELVSQISKESSKESYSEMGRMSGFPKSAIENFIQFNESDENEESDQSKFFLTDEEKQSKIPAEIRKFAQLKLSRKNWKNELETIRRWAEEIKLVDPELYRNLY